MIPLIEAAPMEVITPPFHADLANSIEVRGVYKVFGDYMKEGLKLAQQGASKEDVLLRTGSNLALADVTMHIPAAQIFVIMGLSGSGKSTLVRHFNGLIQATAGEILIDGRNVVTLNEEELRQLRRNKVSMVFQSFGLMPHKSVIENAAFAGLTRGEQRKDALAHAALWLERVGLAGYERHYPDELSGGMKQRVGLARALAANTDILLMDEAFSALDPLIRADMQDQLLELNQNLGKTIVFITHDLDEALRLGASIAILNGGRVAQVGAPKDILDNPADEYVARFVERRAVNLE
ncbi:MULTISPECIES: ATP-binding cassette domain-containing protein [Deinococcus]|nr:MULTISPECIES: ATP-binding cassette domain-containing protein [Deinococcus]